MSNKIVTVSTLKMYFKYDEDLGLMYEHWGDKNDLKQISPEESGIIGEYVDQLHFVKGKYLSKELKQKTLDRIAELEEFVEPEVIKILKEKLKMP